MAQFLKRLAATIEGGFERHRNRDFFKAAMAVSALVAYADGVVRFSERGRIDRILETLEVLRIYDPHEGVDLFDDFVDGLRTDPSEGEGRIMEALGAFSDDAEKGATLVRIAMAVSEADGEVVEAERATIAKIAERLGIDQEQAKAF